MGYIQGDTVITGFDMEYFKKLYIDSLFYGWLGFVMEIYLIVILHYLRIK